MHWWMWRWRCQSPILARFDPQGRGFLCAGIADGSRFSGQGFPNILSGRSYITGHLLKLTRSHTELASKDAFMFASAIASVCLTTSFIGDGTIATDLLADSIKDEMARSA
jgi:hypothetical protein